MQLLKQAYTISLKVLSTMIRTALVSLALAALFLCWSISQLLFRPLYHGPRSNHFDGKRFFNICHTRRSFWVFMQWFLSRKPAQWPKHIDIDNQDIPMPRLSEDALEATFINHSTVLLQWSNINILTDPIWSERCSPLSWIGPRRVHPPGIDFEHLPPIDLILLSHNHYDHMDIPTLKRLQAKNNPLIITGLGNRLLLKKHGFEKVYELDWWQEIELENGLKVIFVPAQHFSGRHLGDRDSTLWGGFILQQPHGVVYFAGDTGYGPHYRQIKERFGSPLLSILPIGAYQPRWFMQPAHQSPQEAVLAHRILGTHRSLAIHFGTFPLSDEQIEDPSSALTQALSLQQIPQEAFIIPKPGKRNKIFLKAC